MNKNKAKYKHPDKSCKHNVDGKKPLRTTYVQCDFNKGEKQANQQICC